MDFKGLQRIYGGNLPADVATAFIQHFPDERHLMVCEYSAMGEDPALILFRQWNHDENI